MSNSNSGFASAEQPSLGDELFERLVVMRPVGTRELDTRYGATTATVAHVVYLADNGDPVDLGERPITWQVVRDQLAKATDETPWIAGTLGRPDRAFVLEPLSGKDAEKVRAALEQLDL